MVSSYFLINKSGKENIKPQELVMTSMKMLKIIPEDKKASFAIFTNGTFRVFTASMYHNQSVDVFIKADNPNVVLVKKENLTWDDFFNTLPFKLTNECLTTGTGETFCTNEESSLKFYINGSENPNALNQIIDPGDKLLVSFGDDSDSEIESQQLRIPEVN